MDRGNYKMKKLNKWLIIALIIPLLSLIILTIYKQTKISFGKTIIIPITGYDPRDLLSGHYLIYRLNYNIENHEYNEYEDKETIYLCVKQLEKNSVKSKVVHSLADNQDCDTIIKGYFKRKKFIAGIERFYIPEEHSKILDTIIRKGQGKLVIKVDNKGNAAIKDLLINDRPWKDYIE